MHEGKSHIDARIGLIVQVVDVCAFPAFVVFGCRDLANMYVHAPTHI